VHSFVNCLKRLKIQDVFSSISELAMASMQSILAFAETVKRGSFAAAARELGLSPSAVAKGVARLEADFGLRLLHRTTRQLSLSSDGVELYERCRRIVDEMDALRADAEGVRGEPSGTLRLNMPVTYGKKAIVPKLAELLRRHPRLRLELSFSDSHVDLIREGLDAVVRIGALSDSSLVGRRIAEQAIVTCASPDYLRRYGVPRNLGELAGHEFVIFRMPSTGRTRALLFRDGRRRIEFAPPARLVLDEGEALASAAVEGLGITQVPEYIAEDAIAAGRLTEVLVRYRMPPTPIYLVYASARRPTPRLRALIALLTSA